MHAPVVSLSTNVEATPWSAERLATAQALAAPIDQRIAQAALVMLTLDDHVAAHAAWSDAQAALEGDDRTARHGGTT